MRSAEEPRPHDTVPTASRFSRFPRFALSWVGFPALLACSTGQPVVDTPPAPTAEVTVPAATATATAVATAAPPACPAPEEPPAPPPSGERAVDISMGMERACAVLEKGGVSCWGGLRQSPLPQVVPGVTEAVDVAVVGYTHEAFVVRRDGSLVRIEGLAAAPVDGFLDAVEVSAGTNLLAVRRRDGTVSITERIPGARKIAWQKLPAKGVRQVSVSGHACVLDDKGQVSCYLYDGGKIKPYPVVSPGSVARIVSGGEGTCAVRVDGTARCFTVSAGATPPPVEVQGNIVGLSSLDGNKDPHVCRDTPEGLSCKLVDLGTDNELPFLGDEGAAGGAPAGTVQWVSNGKSACRRDRDGRVSCWGYFGSGLTGVPDPTYQMRAVKVPGVEGVVDLVIGTIFSCALHGDGRVSCWGASPQAEKNAIRPGVTVVAGVEGVTKLFGAGGDEVCGQRADGSAVCFGGNLGSPWPSKPEEAPQIQGVREMAYPNPSSLLAVIDGAGQVLESHPFDSIGHRVSATKFQRIPGMPKARWIAADDHLLVALSESGQAFSVGISHDGPVGTPRREPKLDGAKEIVGGWIVLWADGSIGVGDPRAKALPREAGAPAFEHVLPGNNESVGEPCGITADGRVLCKGFGWGPVPGLPKITRATGQWDHQCAIDTCGGVSCWGSNWAGQCGAGGATASFTPARLPL